jgi:hypothetical protein
MLVTVAGIPAHPLLVHAVVVLIPLATLGALAVAVRPSWGRPYGPLVAAGALAGAVAATLARLAGDQLEAALDVTPSFEPVIAQHGRLGLYTVIASWPFAVLATAAAVLARRVTSVPAGLSADVRPGAARTGTAARVTAVLAAVLTALAGIVALVFTVLAGHTGSVAVWGHVTQ